jgi:hypothetical protein
MKIADIYAPHTLEFLKEGVFDNLPPGFKRILSGIIAGVLLTSSGARAHELPSKSKQTAQIVATMDQAEYDKWSKLIHVLGLNMKPETFKDRVGVDYRWLRNRLKNGSPDKVAKALQGADTRLMKYSVGDRELWLRPNELEKAKIAVNFLVAKGLNRFGALALVGGFMQESRLNEKAFNKAGETLGIAQWKDTRKEGLPETFMGQLGHVWRELQSTEKRAFGMLQGARSLQDAIKGAARYERFNRKHEWGDRVAYTILLDKLLAETVASK